jgi:DNA-binding transcriptional LysR family regulator
VDLDLAQVRAFVAAAEERHFGRAAARLFLTQQALSKRIARLEDGLGVRLLARDRHGVQLTEAGQRFLAPARRALADGDQAVEAARHPGRPVRIDVWGHLYQPMRTFGLIVEADPELPAEVGQSRDQQAAVTALLRGELDAAFGRVHPAGELGPGQLSSRIVRLEPADALLADGHPLAGRPQLTPDLLRDSGSVLYCPAAVGRLDFLARFAQSFGITARDGGANLGLDHLLDRLRAEPGTFTLLPAEIAVPAGTGIRQIPVAGPVPLYAWSLIWRGQDDHPLLRTLLDRAVALGRQRRWLDHDPARDWLPPPDLQSLSQQSRARSQGTAGPA